MTGKVGRFLTKWKDFRLVAVGDKVPEKKPLPTKSA